MRKTSLALLTLISSSYAIADGEIYKCDFNTSVIADSSGVYEGRKWESKGFAIHGDWIIMDSGNLKLKLTRNLSQHGILRGGEPRKGYQFSLEDGKFIYVSMILPDKGWTIAGTCLPNK